MTTVVDKSIPKVSAEVRVKQSGADRVELWAGISKRHALLEARKYYQGVARCDFADGEPY